MALLDFDVKAPRSGRLPESGMLHGIVRGGGSLTIMRAARSEKLLPDWRGLADRALEPNPFMAPEFLVPAAMHLAGSDGVLLAAAWAHHETSRELIGLFALASLPQRGLRWLRRRGAGLWAHRDLPLAPVLLSREEPLARRAVGLLLDGLAEDHMAGLSLPALEAGAPATELIDAVARERRMMVEVAAGPRRTRGLDLMLSAEPDVSHIAVASEPEELRAMLEQALAMDAGVARLPGAPLAALFDVGELAFLRSMVRGLARTGQVLIARLNDGERKAAALAVLGADRTWLLRLFGPSAHDPSVEAALASALRARTDRPVMAAATEPLAGFCATPLRTLTLDIAFAGSAARGWSEQR